MAKIVLGIGTSHTPMISMPPEFWPIHGELNDKRMRELVSPKQGKVVTYDELLAEADPEIAKGMSPEKNQKQYDQLQRGVAELSKTLREVNPDVLIIVSDDQDENFFEDNMPAFNIYWGDSIKLLPRKAAESAPPAAKASTWGYGDVEMDIPVDAELGKHLVEQLIEADFDVAHSRYLKEEEYGGTIGPAGYVWWKRETAPKKHGVGHGFSFVVKRLMDNNPIPIVPINQNTCYPPNSPTPKRCFSFGRALRDAVEAWDSDKRVAVLASGGLSHFVLDEGIDRLALKGMEEKNPEILCSLPRERLQSAASEIKNWVTVSAAADHLDFELVDYVPVARTAAGTGGGWGFTRWT